ATGAVTAWPCGVRSVNLGATDPAASRSLEYGDGASLAGLFSMLPTPGSVVGEKWTAFAARTSLAGALRSAALGGAGGGGGGADWCRASTSAMVAANATATRIGVVFDR